MKGEKLRPRKGSGEQRGQKQKTRTRFAQGAETRQSGAPTFSLFPVGNKLKERGSRTL